MKTIICSQTLQLPTDPQLRASSQTRVSGLIGRGALEVLKACCELRTGRTPGPSDVAEERRRPCRAQLGHDLSMGRTLEQLGPAPYSPECVKVKLR
jgi:hypothetical protein